MAEIELGLLLAWWNPEAVQKVVPQRKVFLSVPTGHSRKPDILCPCISDHEQSPI